LLIQSLDLPFQPFPAPRGNFHDFIQSQQGQEDPENRLHSRPLKTGRTQFTRDNLNSTWQPDPSNFEPHRQHPGPTPDIMTSVFMASIPLPKNRAGTCESALVALSPNIYIVLNRNSFVLFQGLCRCDPNLTENVMMSSSHQGLCLSRIHRPTQPLLQPPPRHTPTIPVGRQKPRAHRHSSPSTRT
jgi:hypothetical protein